MAQLIVVSNRVAVPESSASARAGGLEFVVNAALSQRTGIWFGWSGKIAPPGTIAAQRVVHKDITFITIDLSREDHQEYYRGFANRVLWPIFHYRIDLAEFSRRDLSGYLRVNDNFARQLDKVLEPDDLVWVHDYHLVPLAKALRERGHKNRIGFFLHIPCPPPEILTALPHHERLIPSLCDYDLVGFQTGDVHQPPWLFNASVSGSMQRHLRQSPSFDHTIDCWDHDKGQDGGRNHSADHWHRDAPHHFRAGAGAPHDQQQASHNGDHSHHFRPHAIDRAQHDRLPGGRRALPPLRRMLPSTT